MTPVRISSEYHNAIGFNRRKLEDQRREAADKDESHSRRSLFGGTCVNTGCTPTKTLVARLVAAVNT